MSGDQLDLDAIEARGYPWQATLIVEEVAVSEVVSPDIYDDAPSLVGVVGVMEERARAAFWQTYGDPWFTCEPVKTVETDTGPRLWPCDASEAQAFRVEVRQRGIVDSP